MANHINNLFKAYTPTEEQKTKMLNKILNESKSGADKKVVNSSKLHNRKMWIQPAIACMLCLLVGIGTFTFIGIEDTFAIYAYGADTEITNTGVELSTGTINDDGEMKGQLMQLYVKGEKIDTIRFSCKNQYIDFTDWTERRTNFSMEKQFTVSYGEKVSDYYYLIVNWNPQNTIRKLNDDTNITIADLGEELKNDTIVMEVTFIDGRKATKAINIILQKNGKVLAKIQDYVVTENDGFVLTPKKNLLVPPKINEDVEIQYKNAKYSKIEIEKAKAIAKKYYLGFYGDREIVSIEYTESAQLLSNGVADKYKNWHIIAFKAYEKSMYPNIARTILLAKENNEKNWIVINEGY